MGRPLRVLIVEDNDDDVALLVRALQRGGYEPDWHRVQSAPELTAALTQGGPWDVVLSDYTMPQFGALHALEILRAHSGYLPFIVVSGSIGEETAVQTMRAGANDYLIKSNLTRLLPAVERELREASERRERARTKIALLELQEQFDVVFREFGDVMLVVRAADGTVLHANPALHRVLGYHEARAVGLSFAFLWPEGRRAQAEQLLARVRRENAVRQSGEFARVDGSLCPMDLLASLAPWGREQVLILTLRDVTERQRAAERLAGEKEHLAVTLRSIGEGVVTTDPDGRVVLMNQVAEQLTGWTQAEAYGRRLPEIFAAAAAADAATAGVAASVAATLPAAAVGAGAGRPSEAVESLLAEDREVGRSRTLSLPTRDGRTLALSVTVAPIRDPAGASTGQVFVFRDTTREQLLEEERQKASKLESVGLLAGGIAHDFNNVLMAIMGNLSLARVNLSTGQAPVAKAVEVIEKAEQACRYATNLTRQLLTFAKGGAPIKQPTGLEEILREAFPFLLHNARVTLSFNVDPRLWAVEVDRNQFRQVIDNVATNAVQATPQGGRISVDAQNVEVSRERPVGDLPPGPYVCVAVRDTGSGIPAEILPKIFDPYFTTKEDGTGLGLAMAYSIIKKHDGAILVESTPQVGSTFSVYLPASPQAVAAASASASRRDTSFMPSGQGRILFMDDEEVLREIVADMLGHLGFEVSCASDGAEAVAQFLSARAEGRPFDAVIVDLTVPGGMGGYEAVDQMRQIDPRVRAIVSSGYSNDPIMAQHRQYGFRGFIAKPYQIIELAKVLHEVLKEDPGPAAAPGSGGGGG